MRIWGV